MRVRRYVKLLLGFLVIVFGLVMTARVVMAIEWQRQFTSSSQATLQQRLHIKQESTQGTSHVRVTQSLQACDETLTTSTDTDTLSTIQRQRLSQYHQEMLNRVKSLVQRLESSGKEVATLETMILELEGRVETADQKLKNSSASFEEVKEVTCEDESGTVRTKVRIQQGQSPDFEADTDSIKSYYFSHIRPALLEAWHNE